MNLIKVSNRPAVNYMIPPLKKDIVKPKPKKEEISESTIKDEDKL